MRPIAIVGMSCRLPGAPDPESLWRLLSEGRHAVGGIPGERWDGDAFSSDDANAAGKMVTRSGAFLSDVRGFDAGFFSMSDDEAAHTDPQQRLLLECAWEAIEDAGIAADRVAGSNTGVYVGIGLNDYGERLLRDPAGIGPHTNTGLLYNFAANRISHALDLMGPSFAIDSACASSAVAISLAAQALDREECDLALAGGAYLILAPGFSVGLSKLSYLSADGHTRAFSSGASGFGFGEGAGVLVLRRLEDAVKDGDRIYAVLLGSAVGQKGRANGLTAPSRPAQESVIRRSLRVAGVAPSDVQFVECMGTAALMGDAIELGALGSVFGDDDRQESRVRIGSIKSNIGHLQPASGVASALKVALALHHRALPPSLHFDEPNPHVDWGSSPLAVQTELSEWPDPSRELIAGLSSFAFGGTQVHLVFGEAPASRRRATSIPTPREASLHAHRPVVLPLSARDEPALRENAARLAESLREGPLSAFPLDDVSGALFHRRAHLRHRAAVTATDAAQAISRLQKLATGDEAVPGVVRGVARGVTAAGAVVVFVDAAEPRVSPLALTTAALRHALARFDDVLTAAGGPTLAQALEAPDARQLVGLEGRPLRVALAAALCDAFRQEGARLPLVIGDGGAQLVARFLAGQLSEASLVQEARTASAAAVDPSLRWLEVADPAAAPNALEAAREKWALDVLGALPHRSTPVWLSPFQDAEALADSIAYLHVTATATAPRLLTDVAAPGPHLPLPRYAWQRRPHWLADTVVAAAEPPSTAAAPIVKSEPTALREVTSLSSEQLRAAAPPLRRELLEGYLATLISSAAGSTVVEIAPDRPVNQLGVDSLKATELTQLLSMQLGATFSLLSVLGGATLRDLASEILDKLPRETASAD